MAIEMTDELRGKLRWLKSAEEVASILKDAGLQASAEEIERIMSELQRLDEQDGSNLSLDELDAVAGGSVDYAKNGCRATVEPGSDCKLTDGGCWLVNVSYDNGPVRYQCPNCGRYMYDLGSSGRSGNDPWKYDLACPYCHSIIQVDEETYKRL